MANTHINIDCLIKKMSVAAMDENVTNFLYKGLGSRVLTQQGGEKKKEEKAKLLTPLA